MSNEKVPGPKSWVCPLLSANLINCPLASPLTAPVTVAPVDTQRTVSEVLLLIEDGTLVTAQVCPVGFVMVKLKVSLEANFVVKVCRVSEVNVRLSSATEFLFNATDNVPLSPDGVRETVYWVAVPPHPLSRPKNATANKVPQRKINCLTLPPFLTDESEYYYII